MAKPDLGEKQLCPHCGAKFYDLGRRPATCPKCAHAFDPSSEALKVRRTKGRAAAYEDEEETTPDKEEADEDGETIRELDPTDPDEPILPADEDEEEEVAAGSEAIPPGFSEAEVEIETEPADDEVPILDDEEFTDEDLEVPDDEEDGGAR